MIMMLGMRVNAQTVALEPIGLNICVGSFDSIHKISTFAGGRNK